MDVFYIFLAFLAGACAPTQAGINSQLRLWTNDPVLAAMVSFAVGTMALFLYVLLLRTPWPAPKALYCSPWWVWTGGLLGAFLVAVTVILAPELGAGTMMGMMVAGQMTAGIVLDHFGVVGYEEHSMNIWRCFGAILVVSGVVIIKRF